MTRFAPLWQQAGTYPAQVDRGLLATLWPTSGSSGAAPATVINTMQVSIPPGAAAVALQSGQNTALCRWDAAEVVTLTAAPPAGSSRIDLVALQVRDNAIDAGANNDFLFVVIAGAGGTPGPGTAPAVPANAYAICQVTVPGGAANLNSATLTDRRSPLSLAPAAGGVLASASMTASTGFVSAEAVIGGLTVSFTAVAGRRYRARFTGNLNKDATAGTCRAFLNLDTFPNHIVGGGFIGWLVANGFTKAPCDAYLTPAAGSHSVNVSILADAGTVAAFADAAGFAGWLTIEDVGPL
jgi:hypothetical protein